jgi:hypothetical protein
MEYIGIYHLGEDSPSENKTVSQIKSKEMDVGNSGLNEKVVIPNNLYASYTLGENNKVHEQESSLEEDNDIDHEKDFLGLKCVGCRSPISYHEWLPSSLGAGWKKCPKCNMNTQ